jgi:AraC family transcriptional regulator
MQDALLPPGHRYRLDGLPAGDNPDGFTVRLRELEARRVAYIRVHRPYEEGRVPEAIARLMAWAEARGLADGQWLGYQWDDPETRRSCRWSSAATTSGWRSRRTWPSTAT